MTPEPLPPPWAKPSGCEPPTGFQTVTIGGTFMVPALPEDPPDESLEATHA